MAHRARQAPSSYFAKRAREKQAAREADERALAEGKKSADDLRRENGVFALPDAEIDYDKAKLS